MLELRPIVVDSNMVVLGGNMRLKACIAAGLKEVPIIVADNLTEQQQAEFIIKDNVGFGEWDWDLLANQWDVEALEDWGLELPFDNTPVLEAEEDDYEAPSEIQTDIVLGDLIEIGNHRLLCGDSTDSDQVARLMDGQKADVAHNDPPYGMKKENDGVLNDNLNYDDLLEFNRQWIPVQFMNLKENGSWYCWGIDEPLMRRIASQTGGVYFKAGNNKRLEEIYEEINKLETTEIEVNNLQRKSEAFLIWALLAGLMMMLYFISKYTWLKSIND
jgi:hypothetical protein